MIEVSSESLPAQDPHCVAVSGPHPVDKGCQSLPSPGKGGEMAVAFVQPPCPPAPLELVPGEPPKAELPVLGGSPSLPQMPSVQARDLHSVAAAQLIPSSRSSPTAHVDAVHRPLAQSRLEVQSDPEGAPWPLPMHSLPAQTPLVQSAALRQGSPVNPRSVVPPEPELDPQAEPTLRAVRDPNHHTNALREILRDMPFLFPRCGRNNHLTIDTLAAPGG